MSAIAADVTSGSATPVAQQKSDGTITGQVLDQNGEPIIGATVTIEGTQKATATGIDGDFVLKAPTGSVVVVKYLGYDDAKAVYNGEPLTIVLKESKFQLEEVVVT
ncbi:MAG: carboxypeptidase-like regulatory domain-containing protein, partial [bacterium]|nr:carboxypeptidase-like regulatory domain-containing protein [bacterium]